MTDINKKIEIVREHLIDQWSIQYAFSKAKIKLNSDEYHFIYSHLINLIDAYKRRKLNDKKHPLYR